MGTGKSSYETHSPETSFSIAGEAGTVDHVGLVIEHEPNVANADWDTTVLSQWGRDGEFLHERRDVSPLFAASTIEVWTERRV